MTPQLRFSILNNSSQHNLPRKTIQVIMMVQNNSPGCVQQLQCNHACASATEKPPQWQHSLTALRVPPRFEYDLRSPSEIQMRITEECTRQGNQLEFTLQFEVSATPTAHLPATLVHAVLLSSGVRPSMNPLLPGAGGGLVLILPGDQSQVPTRNRVRTSPRTLFW